MLKRIFLLTKVLIIGGDFALTSGIGKKRKKRPGQGRLGRVGVVLLYALLGLYLGVIGFFMGRGMTLSAVAAGTAAQLPMSLVSSICLVTLVFGFVSVVTAFYHTNNTEQLLCLPIRPAEIIAARYMQVISYLFASYLPIFGPFFAAYGIYSGQPPAFYPATLLFLFLIPFLALAPVTLLIMVLLRFTKLFKNKDRFTIVSTILILVLSFGLSFSFNMLLNPGLNMGGLPTLSEETSRSLGQVNYLFFGSQFAAGWLSDSGSLRGWLQGLLFLLCTLLWTALLLAVAQRVYFKGVMSSQSQPSKRRLLTERESAALALRSPRLLSFMRKELRILLRTPAFFTQNVLMSLLMPFIIIGMSYFSASRGGAGLAVLREGVGLLFATPEAFNTGFAIVFIAVVGFMLFISGSNGIAAGALTREGSNAYLMKLYPYPFARQLLAKLLVAYTLSLFSPLVLVLAAGLALGIPLLPLLALLILSMLATLLSNLIGLAADLALPKLSWIDEQAAVKQNLNLLIEMFGSLGLGLIICGLAVAVRFGIGGGAWLVFGLLSGLMLLCALLLALIIKAIVPRTLRKISL